MSRPTPRRAACAALVGLALLGSGLAAPTAAAAGPEQIVNGDFGDGLTGWTAYPSPSVVDGRGCIDVPAGTGAYSAAITQRVPMVEGETYALRFTGSVSPGLSSTVRAVVQAGPEQNYAQALPEKVLPLTADAQDFSFTFTSGVDIDSAELAFQQTTPNTAAYRLCVDDVSLTGGAEPEEYAPDTGPRVRVDQVGYLPRGPKLATLVTDETTPVRWRLEDAEGRVVRAGRTSPQGVDPSAGLNVHTVDFSGVTRRGTGYELVADGERSHPFDIGTAAYERLRRDTKTFFYTNRSGTPISDELAPGYGREAGHVGEGPNQGDVAVPCQDLEDDSQALYDEPWTCDYTSDVTGGWYDAGDHGKYVVNGGIAVAQLMQEYERTTSAASADRGALGDGTLRVPESGNGVPDLLDEARWELEWLLKMQVEQGRPLAGTAFHKVADVDWTGLPLAPADDPQRRVLYRPSTAATLNLAAAAAQGARLFAPYDAAFAEELLEAAETAYAAARRHPELYAPAPDAAVDPNPGSGPYDDTDVSDEFYWAAAELYLTTRTHRYAKAVLASPQHTADVFPEGGFDWRETAALGRLDLATVPNELRDRDRVRRSVVAGAEAYLADQAANPFGQAYRPEGQRYAWGSNNAVLNNMQVIGTAYDLTGERRYRDGVARSMGYLFGRNALNISYVTGYGDVFSQNQHSRMYAHQVDATSPNPPDGTVAGGPNSTAATSGDPVAGPILQGCAAQLCYVDDIGSWSTNEITINWNSSISWVSSFLADQDAGGPVRTADARVSYTDLDPAPGVVDARVAITNTGDEALDGWRLRFALSGAQRLQESASVRQTGERVLVTGDEVVEPGETVEVRLAGRSARGATWAPELFRLDGLPVRG